MRRAPERVGVLLSIVIPCFDVEPYLHRCLTSVLDQGLAADEFEVVVIDDGSTDGTRAVADRLALEHPSIVVHAQHNQGVGAARNRGIDLARGDYLYFVDADDYLRPGRLAEVVTCMRRERLDVAMVRGRPEPEHSSADDDEDDDRDRDRDDDDEKSARGGQGDGSVEVGSGVEFVARHFYSNFVWLYLIDRRFLVASGLRFDESHLLEDAVFVANLLSAAHRVAAIDRDVYRYVQRSGSLARSPGADHLRRLVADHEWAAGQLGVVRRAVAADGRSNEAFDRRLRVRQQSFAFFLIARVIRRGSGDDVRLDRSIERLRSIGAYPLVDFPGADYAGLHYRGLAFVFNRRLLLLAFAPAYRLVAKLRALRPARRRHGVGSART